MNAITRYSALESTVQLLPYIGQCLESMKADEEYKSDWDRCRALLRAVTEFEFIFTLFTACQIMCCTKDLCILLQGMNIFYGLKQLSFCFFSVLSVPHDQLCAVRYNEIINYKYKISDLAARNVDVANAGKLIEGTRTQLVTIRSDLDVFCKQWYDGILELTSAMGAVPDIPRRCGIQMFRQNAPADRPDDYYKLLVTAPFLGKHLDQYNT